MKIPVAIKVLREATSPKANKEVLDVSALLTVRDTFLIFNLQYCGIRHLRSECSVMAPARKLDVGSFLSNSHNIFP